MECLAVLGSDYKIDTMLFPKDLSSPRTGGTEFTAGRELSAPPHPHPTPHWRTF